jgi:hypothetical protein
LPLIVASFQKEYGIRLKDEDDMTWGEFIDLLVGLGGDTALGRIVQVRTETNGEIIKNWPAELKKINADWQYKRKRIEARSKTLEDRDSFLASLSAGFRGMSAKPKVEMIKKK